MKQTLSVLFFLAVIISVSYPAFSSESLWEYLYPVKDGDKYFLKNSIEYTSYPNGSEVWFMINYKTLKKAKSGKEYWSARFKVSTDCDNLRLTTKQSEFYSEKMGTGIIVESYYHFDGNGIYNDTYTFNKKDWENNKFPQFCKKNWQFWR